VKGIGFGGWRLRLVVEDLGVEALGFVLRA
jgi:hypothetical protein